MGLPNGAATSAAHLRPPGGPTAPTALLLSGNLGLGHHMVTEVVADSLRRMGWSTEVLDCMSMLGGVLSQVGDAVFRRLIAQPTLFDGIHFSHLRPGSGLARLMDRLATERLVPLLADHLARRHYDAVIATFATSASAIAQLARTRSSSPRPATVVLCTDATPHSLWVHPGIDLYLVTSRPAAAAVRRYVPRASVTIVAAPVRREFFHPPSRPQARARLGIADAERCVLLMGGGWGLGPLGQSARPLAQQGVVVLAVAGQNHGLAQTFDELARDEPRIRSFGRTEDIPTLMAACDVVLTTPGATTCSEARAIGRPLMLLDVLPGHGRDNVQHELELGAAEVCDPDPQRLTASVMAMLERSDREPAPTPLADVFTQQLGEALRGLCGSEVAPSASRRAAGNGRPQTNGHFKEVEYQ